MNAKYEANGILDRKVCAIGTRYPCGIIYEPACTKCFEYNECNVHGKRCPQSKNLCKRNDILLCDIFTNHLVRGVSGNDCKVQSKRRHGATLLPFALQRLAVHSLMIINNHWGNRFFFLFFSFFVLRSTCDVIGVQYVAR